MNELTTKHLQLITESRNHRSLKKIKNNTFHQVHIAESKNQFGRRTMMFYFPHSPGKHRPWSASLLFKKVKRTLFHLIFIIRTIISLSLWMILWCDAKTIHVVKIASFVLFEFILINLHALFGCWDTEIWYLIERNQFYCNKRRTMLWLSLFYGTPFHLICFFKTFETFRPLNFMLCVF